MNKIKISEKDINVLIPLINTISLSNGDKINGIFYHDILAALTFKTDYAVASILGMHDIKSEKIKEAKDQLLWQFYQIDEINIGHPTSQDWESWIICELIQINKTHIIKTVKI